MQHNIIPYKFIDQIKALNFVEKIIVFGSRARGDNKERSDIDLAIFCPEATMKQWFMVLDIIEEADTLLKIDCVRLDELPPHSDLRHNIIAEGIVIYDKNTKQV